MKNKLIFIVLLATSLILLCASGTGPKKKAIVYDGLILSLQTEHVLDWEQIASDKHIRFVYFEIPFPACDTAVLRENVALAQAHGLNTGMCFTFTDSLQNVNGVLDHLGGISKGFSQITPMIAVPTGRTFDRRVIHRWIQIWANILSHNYGEQPILKATREICKEYLAPVLTSTYRICLVSAENAPYMTQHPNPRQTSDPDLIAYPCRSVPE